MKYSNDTTHQIVEQRLLTRRAFNLDGSTRHGDRGMIEAFRVSTCGEQVLYDRDRARGLSHDGHLLGISAELGNVLLDPVQGIALVFEAQVQQSSVLEFL